MARHCLFSGRWARDEASGALSWNAPSNVGVSDPGTSSLMVASAREGGSASTTSSPEPSRLQTKRSLQLNHASTREVMGKREEGNSYPSTTMTGVQRPRLDCPRGSVSPEGGNPLFLSAGGDAGRTDGMDEEPSASPSSLSSSPLSMIPSWPSWDDRGCPENGLGRPVSPAPLGTMPHL